jgi:hypothetical protein
MKAPGFKPQTLNLTCDFLVLKKISIKFQLVRLRYGGAHMGGYGAGMVNRSLREAGRAASSVGSMGEVPLPPSVMRDLNPPYPIGAPKELALAPRPLLSELATQHVAPRRRFVIVTNAGKGCAQAERS